MTHHQSRLAASLLASALLAGCGAASPSGTAPASTTTTGLGPTIGEPSTSPDPGTPDATSVAIAPRGPARAELAAARARWSAAHLGGYAVTFGSTCFCGSVGAWQVHIVRERIVFGGANLLPSAGERPFPSESWGVDATVTGLFATVDKALSEATGDVRVAYDPTYGYPTRVDIDWIVNAADDENSFTMADLEPESLPALDADQQRTLGELVAARARWQAADVGAYSFDYRIGCECPGGHWAVNVATGAGAGTTPLDGSPALADGYPRTIDGMFATAERTIRRGGTISASYDAVDGHPTTLTVDPLRQTVDDEVSYTISDFTLAVAR